MTRFKVASNYVNQRTSVPTFPQSFHDKRKFSEKRINWAAFWMNPSRYHLKASSVLESHKQDETKHCRYRIYAITAGFFPNGAMQGMQEIRGMPRQLGTWSLTVAQRTKLKKSEQQHHKTPHSPVSTGTSRVRQCQQQRPLSAEPRPESSRSSIFPSISIGDCPAEPPPPPVIDEKGGNDRRSSPPTGSAHETLALSGTG